MRPGVQGWTPAGFDIQPGSGAGAMGLKCENAPPARAADFRKLGISERLETQTPAPKLLEKAANADEAVEVLAPELLGAALWGVFKTPDGDRAVIHKGWLRHIVGQESNGIRDARERFAKFILPTLQDPDEIWLVGGRKRFIKVFASGKGGKSRPMLLVLENLADEFLLWTAYRVRAPEINKQRTGTLLYSRELAVRNKDG